MSSRITHIPDPSKATEASSYHLMFFITGNPGLISYYTTFLYTLHNLLGNDPSNLFHIYGQSLAGFDDEVVELSPNPFELPTSSQDPPFSLEQQIKILVQTVQGQRIPVGPRIGQHYDSITLMGHSVGSYIVLELISRLRKSSRPLVVRCGILLFPTVTHIAQSPSGVKISRLFRIPDFPRRAAVVARALVTSTPVSVLRWLVRKVTGMPGDAAEVTVGFLRSRWGVWQAL